MPQEVRTASVLPSEDSTMETKATGDSAPAGCTEIAVTGDCPDCERTGDEGVVNGNQAVEGRGQASTTVGEGKLRGFLQDLVEREGRAQAAERLRVSERTLRRALAGPQLSPFMIEALQRELEVEAQATADEEREPASLPDQLRKVERRLAEIEDIADAQLDELWEVGQDLRQIRDAYAPEPALGTEGKHAPDDKQRRTGPGLVTVEPLPDDGEVYGEALPIVADWRRTLRALAEPPHTLAWLGTTERLLRLEIQLIDDRLLTLPPADAPWDDVRREHELLVRQDRLRELRVLRLWTEPLHWAFRLLTLGRWGRGLSLEQQIQHEFEARRAELLSPDARRLVGRIRNGRA